LNLATWTRLTLEAPFEVMPGAVMWGGRGGGGPRVMPGTYTVTVSSGSWSASEDFHLGTDPSYQPPMTEEEGREQLDMAVEIGATIKDLYDTIGRMRDAKGQAAERVEAAGADSPVARAAQQMVVGLEAVEGDMTQLQGSAGQDALNFPGRMDNQLVVLYGNIVGRERRLGTAVRDRYADLKPEVDGLMQRARAALETEIAAFNEVATAAGLDPIVVR
jgi:hypothetical protein